MFNIKKKNNHNDLSLYMSDNRTVGTIDFYRKKHGGRLPDYMYQMMEVAARKEYNDEDLKEKQAYDKQIMDEYEKRAAEDYVNIVEENNIFA